MLQNLGKVLRKAASYAETKGFEPSVLLNSRLAPDQFPLVMQVQISADNAKLMAARLANKEAPKHEDKETTIDELLTRIDSVVQYLQSFTAADFSGAEERKIVHPRWQGKHLLGNEYLLNYALPNLYFHLTTAYSILRHNGVDLGKSDFLGELPLKA
jgi:hypothetical protein